MSIPHQFADRIIRDALHDPLNLRDLLEMVLGEAAFLFDYDSVVYDHPQFHLPDLHRREADLFCRIKLRTEKGSVETCVCVLIEHQSDEDNSMPLRMLEYAVLQWRWLWNQGPDSKTATLPGILPIVFHTGEGPWRTHRDLGDIIKSLGPLPTVAPLWPILYLNLDEYSTQALLRSTSAWWQALAVVKAEHEKSVAKYSKVVGASAAGIHKLADTDPGRYRRLLEFILRWITARRVEKQHAKLYHAVLRHVRPKHREEIRAMSSKIELTFEEAAQQRYERGKAEGKAEGKTEGKAEGKTEGKAEGELSAYRTLLRRLLEKRFGQLTDELRRQIETATDIELLQTCCEQASEISSPDELAI